MKGRPDWSNQQQLVFLLIIIEVVSADIEHVIIEEVITDTSILIIEGVLTDLGGLIFTEDVHSASIPHIITILSDFLPIAFGDDPLSVFLLSFRLPKNLDLTNWLTVPLLS